MLKILELKSGYGNKQILNGISLEVRKGEIVAIIGPNGSGKTTMMRAMCRVLKPSGGRVLLDGRDIREFHARRVAQIISWVSQNNRLAWPFTVHQVVSMGRFPHRGWVASYTKEDHRAVDAAIRATGLWEHRERLIDTLSGGEAQRAVIARALAQTPRVLLLDEPVAHLDMKYKIAILDLVRNLSEQGLSIVISLHDLNLAGLYADRIALLSEGKLFATGVPDVILTKKNLERVYETEVVISRHPLNDRPQVTPISSFKKKEALLRLKP